MVIDDLVLLLLSWRLEAVAPGGNLSQAGRRAGGPVRQAGKRSSQAGGPQEGRSGRHNVAKVECRAAD